MQSLRSFSVRGSRFAAKRLTPRVAVAAAPHYMVRRNFSATRYARSLSVMHWTMAAGILSAFALIEVKKRQPKGSDLIGPLMHWHKSIGVLCGGLVIARLGLRFTTKIPAMVEGPAAMHNAAKLSHLGLYSAMIFFPTTGVLMGYYGGKGIPFFWTKIEGAKEGNKTIAKNSWKLHKKLGVFFEALVALHACGAVAHLMMGQNIFGRISPFSGAALFSLADEDDEDDDDDLLS